MKRVESAIQDIAWLDSLARRETWATRIDPRAKAVVTLAFIITVASFHRRAVIEMLPLASYPLIMFLGGQLPAGILRKPLWVALMLAVLIGIANPLLDREPVRIGADTFIRGGWLSFLSILLRAVFCVTSAIALIATTGMERLCHGLGRLGVPRVVVVQLLFLYRYAFLLGSNALAMSRARELRSCGQSLRFSTYGPLVGHLLLRTLDRAERIHQAMCCRGFRGDVPVRGTLNFRWFDATFVVLWCGSFILLRWYLPIEKLGALLAGGAL